MLARPKGTVVVADDDDDERMIASYVLRKLGFTVLEARDGKELCEQVLARTRAGESLDMIVTDVGMPMCTGVDAARWINELVPEVPIIVITGYRDPAIWSAASQGGIKRIIGKPFAPAELADAVTALL